MPNGDKFLDEESADDSLYEKVQVFDDDMAEPGPELSPDCNEALIVELKKEVTNLKYLLNDTQRLFFETKLVIVQKDKHILDLLTGGPTKK